MRHGMEANDERVHHFPTKIGKKLRQELRNAVGIPHHPCSFDPEAENPFEAARAAKRRPPPQPGLGDRSEGVPPVPIPNTEVKPLSPDGTACASVWESRKSPNYSSCPTAYQKARPKGGLFALRGQGRASSQGLPHSGIEQAPNSSPGRRGRRFRPWFLPRPGFASRRYWECTPCR